MGKWIAGIALGLFLAIMVYSVYGGGSSNGVPNIVGPGQYQEVLGQAQRLSEKHLVDFDNGKTLSAADIADLTKAAKLFDGIAEYQSTNIGPYLGAGKCYQAIGQDQEAVRRLEQGLATVPPNPIMAVQDTAIETHYVLSKSLFNLKDYDDALKEVNTAMKALPFGSPIYLTQRAEIYMQMNKYPSAVADLVYAEKLDPKYEPAKDQLKLIMISGDGYRESAGQKLAQGDYNGALDDCNKGLALGMLDPQMLQIRAQANKALGKSKAAQADLDLLQVHALQLSSGSKLASKNYAGAIADASRGLGLAKDDPILLRVRAESSLKSGDKAQAKKDLDAILRSDPTDPEARRLRSQIK